MIALAADCILLRQPNGEAQPASGYSVAVEVVADGPVPFDEDFVKEASAAVLHFFKEVEGRESVTLDEFAQTLETVLKAFQSRPAPAANPPPPAADLRQLADDAGVAFELNFFPRLRDLLRAQLDQSPRVVRFSGLRPCVKRLTGARRWNARCQSLQAQIVQFLRECLSAEAASCSLVVE